MSRNLRISNRIGLLILFLSLFGWTQAATITSTAKGGKWSSKTTWVGGVLPATTDAVVIATTGTGSVFLGSSTTCASVTVNAGSKLVVGRRKLTVNGPVSNAGTITFTSGRITQNAIADFTNSGTITFTSTGRLSFTGNFSNTGTLTLGLTAIYYTGANAAATTSSGFTTTGAVFYQRTAGSVTFTSNVKGAALTVSGNGGTLHLGAGLSHTFTGAVTISAGTFNGGSSVLNLNLLTTTAWNYNAGTFTAGTGTVNFGGAGAQTLGGTLTSTFNNLTFSGSGLKTLSRVPVVNGVLSMEGTATVSTAATMGAASTIQYKGTGSRTVGVEFPTTFAGSGGVIVDQGSGNTVTLNATKTAMAGNLNVKSGTFDLSSFTVNRTSAGGTLTVAAAATLKIRGTNTLPSNYAMHSIDCNGTIEYGGAAQTVALLNSSQIYGNLTLSGTGTKTLPTGITAICNNLTMTGTTSTTAVVGLSVGGNVDLQAGSTFVAGAFTHRVGGSWTNTGTFVSTGSTVDFYGDNAGDIGACNFNNLIFSGAGLKTAVGAWVVAGAITISNNLDAGSFAHTVSGNWTNNATFTAGTSTFTFNGNTSQSIAGTASSTFSNLTMDGTGGVVLGINTRLTGTLTLTKGLITIGNFNLTAGGVTGGGASTYVKTSGTGVLMRSVTADVAADFPVGNASYCPLTLTNTTSGNVDGYAVRVIDGALTNANDNTKTVNHTWQLYESEVGGSALTVSAAYNAGETGGNFDPATTPTLSYFDGTSWMAPLPATVTGSGPYTYSTASGAFTSEDLTTTSGYLSLGSGDAFNASKLVIASINPSTPFVNQNNVTIVVESVNSNNVLTSVTKDTGIELTAANTTLAATPTGRLLANTYSASLTGVGFTTLSTTATVTATATPGDVLSPATSAPFSVIVSTIYKPSQTGVWNTVQWLVSMDGGTVYTNTTLPTDNLFSASDLILVPSGVVLTVDGSSASFYNMRVEGTLDLLSGTLTLNHSGGGDYGFQVFGTFQNSGGSFVNSNETFPIFMQGGTYIHAKNGGTIPVAKWNSFNTLLSTCKVTGITTTALTAGLNQIFQNFTWDNASQTVTQTLSANLTVNGALTLSNGVLTTGPVLYVVVAAGGSVTSLNNGRVHGNFRRYVPNTTAPTLLFPIGDATSYTPMTVAFSGTTTGSGYLNASTMVAQPPRAAALSQTQYINRNWTLSNAGVSGFTSYSSTFTFANSDKIGSPNPSNLIVRRLTSGIWATTQTGTQDLNATQCTGLLAFGSFAIGEDLCSSSNATWFGGTSKDWNTGSNWCNGMVPTSTVDVYIPSGLVNQPVISASAACRSITIDTGSSLTVTGSNTLSVYGNWIVNGSFAPGSGTVVFMGATAQTMTGVTTFNNLTINNSAGVSAANNCMVNGILNLQSENASATQGALHMGANTLYMGVAATTVGIGDVTGIIMRTHSFTTNVFYSFGNANSGITFATISGQTLPATMGIKLTLGVAPSWTSSNSSGSTFPLTPLTRLYDVYQVGGSGTSAIFRVYYKDNEIPVGVNESKLSLWHRVYMGPGSYMVMEVGKSNQDVTNNFISIQDVDLATIPSTWGNLQEAIAPTQATILTWVGGTKGATTDWYTSTNWDPVAVPSAEYGVDIPDAATTGFDPIVPAGADSCVSVLIETGGILNMASGANLVLTGSDLVWTKETGGVFNAGNSTVTVAGLAGFSSFVGSTDFYNVTVADGASLRPADGCYMGILGTLSLSSTGVLAAATNDNTVEYKGAATQTIINPVGYGEDAGYSSLILSGSNVKTMPSTALRIVADFSLAGTASVSPLAALTIGGNMTLGSGTTFIAGNLTHSIGGNFINNGASFTGDGSTIHLNGTLNQVIDGTAPTSFDNLTLTNSNGATLGIDETVNGTLDLTSGLITTGANSLIVGCLATINNASAASYVNGKLVRVFCTTGSKTFPIGKGGNYRPFTLNYTELSGTSTVYAEQFEQTLPGTAPANTSLFADRYWHLTQTGGSNYTYNVTLDGTGWTPDGTAKMIVGDGTTNVAYDVTTPDYTNATSLTDLGNFGLGSYLAYITWLGSAIDNSWFNTANWSSASVPLSTDDIRIPSSLSYYPVISGTSPDHDVTISGSGKLSLQDGAFLTLEASPLLTFESGATVTTGVGSKIILQSNARYLNLSSSTPTLEMRRQLTATKGWRMVASPLATTYSDMFKAPLVTQGFTGATYPLYQPNLMWWDETDGGTTLQGWRKPTHLTDAISGGRGYFHYVFNGAGITGGGTYTDVLPQTLTVTGVEHYNGTGTYEYSLTNTPRAASQTPTASDSTYDELQSLDMGWNLIGNPTASTLDWDAAAMMKTNIDQTFYVWDPSALSGNGDYLYWNGTTGTLANGKIAPFQAFWVHANDASPSLSFSNAAKVGDTATFLRSIAATEEQAVVVPLTLNGQQMQTTSFLTFEADGKVGADSKDAYLLESMNDTWIKLYTSSSPNHISPLVINNLPLQDTSMVNIPVFVDGEVNGNGVNDSYTLDWEIPSNWPSDWSISLQDHQSAEAISMTDHTQYTFTKSTQSAKAAMKSAMYSPEQLVKKSAKSTQSKSYIAPFNIVIAKGGKTVGYMEPHPHLLPNYPNPFANSTNLCFSLPASARVRIEVYDLNGLLIENCTNAVYDAGFTILEWKPANLLPGVYFIRFISGDTVETQKAICTH